MCDLVSLERMAQRLGRANRFGDGSASVHVVLAMKPKALHAHVEELESLIAELPGNESDARKRIEKRIAELEKTLNRCAARAFVSLERLPIFGNAASDGLNASPEALSALCREPGATEAYSPNSPPPPLDPARLDDWALTSLRQSDFPRPQVSYWLRGITPDETVTTQLAWRRDLDFAASPDDVVAMAQAIPLAPAEIAQVATPRAAKLLVDLAKAHPEQICGHAHRSWRVGRAALVATPVRR